MNEEHEHIIGEDIMKDGYYLSTYIYINKLAYLTNEPLRHDQCIALWKKVNDNIELVHYWEFERVTGLKQHKKAFYDVDQAKNLINDLLKQYNLSLDDMIEVWGTPELDTAQDYDSLKDYPKHCYHSICHMVSSLMSDTDIFNNETVLSLAVDGAPDNVIDLDIEKKMYYSGCISKDGKLIDVFPVYSPGVLWNVAKYRYGLREGSLMALATASNSELINYSLNNYLIKGVNDMSDVVDDLFHLFDYVDQLIDADAGIKFNYFDDRFSEEENKISMVMKLIQEYSKEILCQNIDDVCQKYNMNLTNTYLCISGGYGLNCPTNSYLMKKYKFKGFLANPCISDCGLAMGIGLYAFYRKLDHQTFHFKLKTAYYGNSDDEIEHNISRYQHYISKVDQLNYAQIAKDINEAPIVWFNGRSEVGPRALGNRSILASPSSNDSKDILNRVKQRQWWRPVAPIVLKSKVAEWFEDSYESPFMLHTFTVYEDKRELVPAILHLDNSARVQTVTAQDNEEIYKIIEAYDKEYNIPIICNTSLNDRGEPIIDTIQQGIDFAIRKGFRVGYFNGYRIEFRNHNDFKDEVPKRQFDVDAYISESDKDALLQKYNPFNLSSELLHVYIENPRLYKKIDITTPRGKKMLEGISQLRMSRFHML